MEGYLDNIFLNVMMPCVASYKVEEEDGARRVTERLWSILWGVMLFGLHIVRYLSSCQKMYIDRCIYINAPSKIVLRTNNQRPKHGAHDPMPAVTQNGANQRGR